MRAESNSFRGMVGPLARCLRSGLCKGQHSARCDLARVAAAHSAAALLSAWNCTISVLTVHWAEVENGRQSWRTEMRLCRTVAHGGTGGTPWGWTRPCCARSHAM